MSAVAEPVADALAGDRLARRNALVLAIAQALAGGNNTVLVATAAIVGTMLAPDKGLATLPISIFVLGMWMGTLPMGVLARRLGRRNALQIGTGCGVLTGLICCVAVLHGSFFLFNVGAVFSGFYASAHQSYRFAAADTASDEFRPKAISWVLFGGILAGVVGAQLVIATQDLWPPYLFAATYIGQSALALVAGGVLMFVNIPKPPPRSAVGDGRPLSEIAREPRFIVAVACGVAAYSMMNLVMTSAPLAMVMCNHSITDATLGLQWHVLGMYAPSFITGALITRFGLERITGLGFALIIVAAGIGIAGISLWHFWIGLALLGVGWNFAFIGATTMVTHCHRPNERNKVQAFNDFLVFGSMAIGSFSSGQLLASFGWATVNEVVFPVVLAASALLLWSALRRRASYA
ncbi:MAG TPA: MFS transporter [Xanthobacteraceae bacterium]|jgi:predicted MFS family arabinose efflux permease